MMKKTFTIFFILFGLVSFSQSEKKFEEGKEFYREAEYKKAVGAWKSILDAGEHSAALYYNLGNAHYKLDNVAESIYYYEKALQLAPNDKDIQNNLVFAQDKTIDAIEPIPQNIFKRWYNSLINLLSFNGWAWATVIFAIGFSAIFLLYYFSTSVSRKRLFFSLSFLSLFLTVISLLFAFDSYSDFKDNKEAIVFAESVQVKSEPLNRSEISFVLHEGTKVKITAEDGNWSRIELADGKEGWILKENLKRL